MKYVVLPLAMIALLVLGGCSNSEPETDTPSSSGPPVTFETDCSMSPGTVACDSLCVPILTDVTNCGACGMVCPAGVQCNQGQCSNCPTGVTECNGMCTDLATDTSNCGTCGATCSGGSTCTAGVCQCRTGAQACDGVCVSYDDASNCGTCGNDCATEGLLCAVDTCTDQCPEGTEDCNGSCVDVQSSFDNCGGCGMACEAGQACSGGSCGCEVAGQVSCDGACVDPTTSPLHCGGCNQACAAGEQCVDGACGAPPVGGGGGGNTPGDCPVTDPGMIANFEAGSANVIEQEGRAGVVEQFNDGSGEQTTTIEIEGADECNQGVLHTVGKGFNVWGSGLGTVFAGTIDPAKDEYVPEVYDASKYTAISFRAKKGPGQQNPVRFNISTPATEGAPHGAGSCEDMSGVDNPCWNHLGQFLIDDEELTTQWQTLTFCFDRDLYPMFLPSHVSVDQRRNVNKELLKLQFQFNQSFNPETGDQVSLSGDFDFYIDDIRFTNPASCDGTIFESTGGAKQPFGSNAAIGTCMPVPDSAKFNKAISEAYARWKLLYVRGDGGVIDPDEGDRVVSEAIGYGMLITAAMGDKETFDKIYGWAKGKGVPGTLLGWNNGGGGSATDGDTDMAFALLMAGAQWGGSYAADGNTLAGQARTKDVEGNLIRGGENFKSVFNPSYFSPGFYRKFDGWGAITDTTYGAVERCAGSFGGLVPDWCTPDTNQAIGAGQTGAQVQAAEVCPPSDPCLAFESARTPWRLGYDLCFDGQGQSLLTGFLNKLKQTDATLMNGSRIDTIEAGWTAGGPLDAGVGNAMAFIGSLGVAGQGLGDAPTRDRAFRATLDIMERPEFYNTYYQTTLGLLTLLTMTGNFPTP